MKFKCSISIMLFLTLFSCCREKDISCNLVWEHDLNESEIKFIDEPILVNDKVIIPIKGLGKIICFNRFKGNILWEWDDALDEFGVDGFGPESYVHNGILVVGNQNLVYGIDIENGNTIWNHQGDETAIPLFTGFGDNFYYLEYIFQEKYWLLKGNIQTGIINRIFSFERNDEYFIEIFLPKHISFNNKEYIGLSELKWGSPNGPQERHQFLKLLDLSTNEIVWTSDTIPKFSQFNAGYLMAYDDGKIFLENETIYCYSAENGDLIWNKKYENTFSVSKITVNNNLLFANNSSQFMVALETHSGKEVWKTEPTGSISSRIKVIDDRIYTIGGFDGNGNPLIIMEKSSGEILAREEAPLDSEFRFINEISVDQDGLIYCSDGFKIYCFEYNNI